MFDSIIPINVGVSAYAPNMYFPEVQNIEGEYEFDQLLKSHIDQEFNHYTDTLLNSPKILAWFRQRGIPISADLIQRFSLGFADNSFGKMVSRKYGRKAEMFRGNMQRAGLYKSTGRPFFHGDIVFQFKDESGELKGAYGRRVSNENRSSKLYYRHWELDSPLFFNIDALSNSKTLILTKSAMEALSFISYGFENVIGTMGIYSFSEKHLQKLVGAGLNEVIIAFDNTDQGNHVSGAIAQCLNAEGIFCSRISLPKNHDINLFVQRYGDAKSSLSHLVDNRFGFTQKYENLIAK